MTDTDIIIGAAALIRQFRDRSEGAEPDAFVGANGSGYAAFDFIVDHQQDERHGTYLARQAIRMAWGINEHAPGATGVAKPRKAPKMSKAERAHICELRLLGITYAEISTRVGRSKKAVQSVCYDAGLPKVGRGKRTPTRPRVAQPRT